MSSWNRPWKTSSWEIDLSGQIVNPQVASGFQFLGFIDFDPTGRHGDHLFGPDALTGKIWKIDIATGQKELFVDGIFPGPVGLVFDADGRLYFNVNYGPDPGRRGLPGLEHGHRRHPGSFSGGSGIAHLLEPP